MSDEVDWNRAKEVVHDALARAPQDRGAFLRDACGGDQALQAEVESLLDAHARAGDFAERPTIEAIGDWSATADALPVTAEPVLQPGNRIGRYHIQALLGAGGMGEVYRAHDTTLSRDVAIKILPAAFAADRGRLARFEREARLLAALNHPRIGAIYGIEEAEGIRALVLELVEGATLADRLDTGPVPIHEALIIARQIAEALDAAHDKGIVHRDLKPANVKIAPAGTVKVLDFGLAKAVEGSSPGVLQTRNVTIDGTREGLLLGTPSYMSPEQSRGKAVDKRADIWAFGCVLYEMLTGRAAFPGETILDHVAAILERDPDWTALPPDTPPGIVRLLRRCLEKDPSRRLRDIGDARLEIDEELAATTPAPALSRRVKWRRALVWASVAVTGAASAGLVGWRTRSPSSTSETSGLLARFAIALPPGEELGFVRDRDTTTLALSPDGRYLAYVAGPRLQLYLRAIDRFDSKPVPGTEGADNPFFSPDGEWLAFFADGKLKKVSVAGGVPLTLCTVVSSAFGASWAPDGTIVFAPSAPGRVVRGAGLLRVPANGGPPSAATVLAENESGPRWPELLPDGKTVLFSETPSSGTWSSDATIYLQSLETGKRRALIKGVGAHYLPTGYLIYTQLATLFAVPFDLARLAIAGDPVTVVAGLQQTDATGPQVSVSRVGTLAYAPAIPEPDRILVWVDRSGTERPLKAPARRYFRPLRLSPDGQRVAMAIQDETQDLWVYDLLRDTLSRLTWERLNGLPVWTPDGRRLTFSSVEPDRSRSNIYWKPSDGSGPEEELRTSDHWSNPSSWSPDGRVLAFVDIDLAKESSADFTYGDIWWLSLDDKSNPHPFLRTKFKESAPVFSPDGRWLAYGSDESGRKEIYVRPFPGPGGKWQISTDGGTEPVWPRNARELFYRNGDAMMAVEVNTTSTFSAGQPRRVFEGGYARSDDFFPNYDVTSDGQRFVMVKTVGDTAKPTQINVVLNWLEELKRRAPAK